MNSQACAKNSKQNAPQRALVEAELASTREELAELKRNPPTDNTQQPAAELKLPSPADLLNRLKARRKKSKADLADIEAILELIED
jgi:outer membrane protein TolC